MAASKHINPDQLRLFMTPKEIMEQYHPLGGDVLRGESYEDVWDRKAEESHNAGLTKSISEQGVQIPVSLSSDPRFPEIMGGHHRIAAANSIDPNMHIPVTYEDSTYHARLMESRAIGRNQELWDLPDTEDYRKDWDTTSNYDGSSS